MRPRFIVFAVLLVVIALPLWPACARAAAPAPQGEWDAYVNATYGWSMRYPAGWRVNQGDLGPLPAPITTKFSTYAASAGQKIALTAADAEVWVTVTDGAAAASAASDFTSQGYAERKIAVAGLPATRYTAAQPAFGLYDAVILVVDGRTYRIYLSASTHAFDTQFQSMLDSLEIGADYHSDAGFSVRYPISWKARFDADAVTFEPPDAGGMVTFGVLHVESKAAGAEQVVADRLSQLAKDGVVENLEQFPGQATLAGQTVPKSSYRYVRKADRAEIKGMDLALKHGEVVYLVRYAASPQEYDRWINAFDKFAASFRVRAAATLAEVLARPLSYEGEVVTLSVTFLGKSKPATPQPAIAAPPMSPADWLVQDRDLGLYVQAGPRLSQDSLSPDLSGATDAGKRLRITGTVRVTSAGYPFLEPFSIYPELAGAWVRRGGADGLGLALELSQSGASLRGQMRVTDKAGEAAPRPVVGSIVDGRKLRLQTSDAGPAVVIEASLAADGRSFSGTRKSGAGAAEDLVMGLAEPALPGTGADFRASPASIVTLLILLATLLATCCLALALGAAKRDPEGL